MKIFKKNKLFWTFLSFVTFALFLVALVLKIYWLNLFVIVFGLLIDKRGIDSPTIKRLYSFERRN